MDFDSPDVAKEFPGLTRALTDVSEYDERDKSKKKKEKKDSKKDKDKGYAALNDSPDEDEAETKSPGKSIKIKAFKLTSKKKEKDRKDSIAVSLPETSINKEAAATASTHVDPKLKASHQAASEAFQSSAAAVSEAAPITRRPFDGQGYTNAVGDPKKTSKKSKHHGSISGTASGGVAASDAHVSSVPSLTEKKGLSVFTNAPVPHILRKKEHKEKDAKKEHGPIKVKLKLRKSSKSSFEESPPKSGSEATNRSPNSHLPEDPEKIAKEIRRYEVMLEQAHLQVKSGKKINKKMEDQLWELQMTLTQLKRKLRSVNALSASFHSPPSISIAPAVVAITSSASTSSEAETVVGKLSAEDDHAEPSVIILSEPINKLPEEKLLVSSEGVTMSEVSLRETTSSVTAAPETVLVIEPPAAEPTVLDALEQLASSGVEVDRRDTIQVEVEVHTKSVPQENRTPEDIYEQEITSFNGNHSDLACGVKRENLEKGRRLLHVPETPESSKSKSEEPPSSTVGEESVQGQLAEVCLDEGEYVFLRADPEPKGYKGSDEEAGVTGHSESQSRHIRKAPSIFDPFAIPEFKTDEFISYENEALILFTQKLQDEIVKEEEQIEELIRQIQEASLESATNTWTDLEELDDDDLFNLWQTVKFENDTLNEQVLNLKKMVASSRLEEFRLETRVTYLQAKAQHAAGIGPLETERNSS